MELDEKEKIEKMLFNHFLSMNLDTNIYRYYWINKALHSEKTSNQIAALLSRIMIILGKANGWKEGKKEDEMVCKDIMLSLFPDRHKPDVNYKPFPTVVDDDKKMHLYISKDAVKNHIKSMADMELTSDNCLSAGFDLLLLALKYKEGLAAAVKNNNLLIFSKEKYDDKKIIDTKVPEEIGFNLPVRILNDIKKTADSPEFRQYIPFMNLIKEMYWDLNSIKQTHEDEIKSSGLQDDPDNYDLYMRHKKAFEDAFNDQYENLREFLRSTTYDIDASTRVKLLLSVSIADDTKKDTWFRCVADLLKEEFLLYIINLDKDNLIIPEFTENAIEEIRGFNDYESDVERTVDFLYGQYESEDGKRFVLAENPNVNGIYTIRKNEQEKWVASRRIRDFIKVPEPDLENPKLMFITKMSDDKRTEAAEHDRCFEPNTTITLVIGADIEGKREDAVVIDGKSVTTFLCTSYNKKTGHYNSDTLISELYRNVQGEVNSVAGAKIRTEKGESQYVAIITLKNIRRVVAPETKASDFLKSKDMIAENSSIKEKITEVSEEKILSSVEKIKEIKDKFSPSNIKIAQEISNEGIRAKRAEQFDDAICYYQEVIRMFPTAGGIYYNLGKLFYIIGDFSRAQKAYTLAYINNANVFDETLFVHLGHALLDPDKDNHVVHEYRKDILGHHGERSAKYDTKCYIYGKEHIESLKQLYERELIQL